MAADFREPFQRFVYVVADFPNFYTTTVNPKIHDPDQKIEVYDPA